CVEGTGDGCPHVDLTVRIVCHSYIVSARCGKGVVSTITEFSYSHNEDKSSECEQDSEEKQCSLDLTDKPYSRCLGKHSCKVGISSETKITSWTRRGQGNLCSHNFKRGVIVHVQYECKEIEREDDHTTTTAKSTAATRPPRNSPTTTRRTTLTTSRRTSTVREATRQASTTKTVTSPADAGDTSSPVTGARTILKGKVGQQRSTDSAQGGAGNTGLIVGSIGGVLVLCVGAIIAFVLLKRRKDGDLKMRPATLSSQKMAHSFDGPYVTSAYSAEHVYEEALSAGNVYEDLPESHPQTTHAAALPPVPSRTPSNESTVPQSPLSAGPPLVPSRSPSTDEEHPYLELISGLYY
ncbi:hypothetical protein NP493_71g03032, partial [Ridgeia piscesae]